MFNAETIPFTVVNGNNVTFSDELEDRIFRIFLDAECEYPRQRDVSGFNLPGEQAVKDFIEQHREKSVNACLTLIQHWIEQGKPLFKDVRKGSFSGWAEVVGGVLTAAGYNDFLGNEKTFENEDRAQDRALVNFMLEIFGNSEFTSKAVYQKIKESQFEIYLGKNENDGAHYLGNVVFKKIKNRVFEIDGCKVKLVQTGKRSKRGNIWKLEGENRYTSDTPGATVENDSEKSESAQNMPSEGENRYTTDTPGVTPHSTIENDTEKRGGGVAVYRKPDPTLPTEIKKRKNIYEGDGMQNSDVKNTTCNPNCFECQNFIFHLHKCKINGTSGRSIRKCGGKDFVPFEKAA